MTPLPLPHRHFQTQALSSISPLSFSALPSSACPRVIPHYRIGRDAHSHANSFGTPQNPCSSAWQPCSRIRTAARRMASHVPSATTAKSTDATASGTNGGNRSDKVVWVMTQAKEVVTAALEAGWGTVVVEGVEEEGDGGAGKKAKRKGAKDGEEITEGSARSVEETREAFEKLGRVRVVTRRGGAVYGTGGERVAAWVRVSSAGEQEAMCALAGQEDVVVMDAEDWKVIPAENAVAAFAPTRTSILGVATTAQDAQVLLESLEVGLDGVVLRTSDPTHVFSLKSYLSLRSRTASQVALVPATVTAVAAAGMGHRVCVDLCSLLPPGAGLLVGSFARGLFLVHAECLQSDYVASRPFRVNAGPVHSYVAVPGGRTAYLSELTAGSTVLVVERTGQTWPATVGRVKVEARPLTLVSAKVCVLRPA